MITTTDVTDRVVLRDARSKRIPSQWGEVSLYEWMRLEADRLTRAGSPSRRRTVFNRCWIETFVPASPY